MANPFSKGWKYLTASLDQKIDENADPMVQIHQATEAAKQQHEAIARQAAQVIGNRNQLEMKLNRLLAEQEKLAGNARSALQAADAADSPEKAQQFNGAAELYATQLVSVETQIEETKALHAQAVTASEQATSQVKQSEAKLAEQLAQIDELRTQVQQTEMQEATTQAVEQMAGVQTDPSVPTLDAVREKIERRYANALGQQELTQHTMGERIHEIEAVSTDTRAAAKLDEIRAQLAAGGGSAQKALEDAAENAENAGDTGDAETDSTSASNEQPKN